VEPQSELADLVNRQDLENAKSKLETFRAMSEQRGYKEAPVSVLFLNGRPPDLVFQKQNDTFNLRHHLRTWQRRQQFQGRDVWVCSATHDTGIDFLLFTGLVTGLSLVDRPAVPVSLYNATGTR
jgi:hypothetical protein